MIERDSIAFPERCVVCNQVVQQSESMSLQANWSSQFHTFRWLLGMHKKLSVPAHQSCGEHLKKKIRRPIYGSLLVVTGLAIFQDSLQFSDWFSYGLILIGAIFYVFWKNSKPLPFEFTYENYCFRLIFANKQYAYEVAKLNGVEADRIIENI